MLNATQIIIWISIKQVALELLGVVEGELDSCRDCDWCIFKVKHKCLNNIDSLPDHHLTLSDTSWCCERGPMRKMISINNNPIELVSAVIGTTEKESIEWINAMIKKYEDKNSEA